MHGSAAVILHSMEYVGLEFAHWNDNQKAKLKTIYFSPN